MILFSLLYQLLSSGTVGLGVINSYFHCESLQEVNSKACVGLELVKTFSTQVEHH